jgi:hypothetical protein
MSTIRADVEELTSINAEIKRISDAMKVLRKKKEILEKNIASFLNEKDLPGVKFNGDIVLLEKKTKQISANKKTREQALVELLRKQGLHNPEEIANQIHSLGKEKVTTQKIKINKREDDA